jgi:hypothetical protein
MAQVELVWGWAQWLIHTWFPPPIPTTEVVRVLDEGLSVWQPLAMQWDVTVGAPWAPRPFPEWIETDGPIVPVALMWADWSGEATLTVTPPRFLTQRSAGREQCRLEPPERTNASYCRFQATECVCVAGHYLHQDDCLPCAEGTFKPDWDTHNNSASCVACPPGWTSPPGSTRCYPCPVGTATHDDAFCTPCPAHAVAPVEGMARCVCGAGYFYHHHQAPGNTTRCVGCPQGFYKPEAGDGLCFACDVGSTPRVAEAATVCDLCVPGTARNRTRCAPCAPGWYASHYDAAACVPCPVGTHGRWGGLSACTPCGIGRYAEAGGAVECALCAVGTYALGLGESACTACAPGTIAPYEGVGRCAPCDEGQIQPRAGASACTPCPEWMVPDVGGALCHCAAGTAPDVTQTRCVPCALGKFKAEPGPAACALCDVYATTADAGQTACTQCRPGAVRHNETCRPCAPGTFFLVASQADDAVCVPCATGTVGLGWNAPCSACPPDTYAGAAGASVCTPCPLYSVAPDGGASACDCRQGRMVADGGGGGEPLCQCAAGAAPDIEQTLCVPCALGKFKAEPGPAPCALCDVYATTADDGQTACTQCRPGAVRHNETCRPCAPGTFFLGSSSVQAGDACVPCAVGTAGLGWNAPCSACPPDTYAGASGASVCTPCPPFSSAPDGGARLCACLPGYIRTFANPNCTACPPGHIRVQSGPVPGCRPCGQGTYMANAECVLCPRGTYAPVQAATACVACPEFMTTESVGGIGCRCMTGAELDVTRGVCVPCPAGRHIHPLTRTCDACTPGTYAGAAMATACEACPPGTTGPQAGLSACLNCSLWVTPDRTECQCPPETFFSQADGRCTACTRECATGHYLSEDDCTHARDRVCRPCTPACPTNSYRIALCSRFNDLMCRPCRDECPAGQFVVHECAPLSDIVCRRCQTTCPAGTYLQALCTTRADRVCAPCPPGEVSGGGDATACTQCAGGEVGVQGTTCVACPAWAYRNACVAACPPGSYPRARNECAACPAGSYSPDGRLCVACVGCVSADASACDRDCVSMDDRTLTCAAAD